MSTNGTLPHWNMAIVFPDLESDQFVTTFDSILEEIESLKIQLDQWQIDKQASVEVNAETVQRFETLTNRFNTLYKKASTLTSYLHCRISTNSKDDAAMARLSRLRRALATLSLLGTRYTAWLGSLDVEALIAQSELAEEHSHALRRAKVSATHLMSPVEEGLASELRLTGGGAWTTMFNTYGSQLMVDIELDGEEQTLPLTAVHNLAHHPDRDVRQRAYDGAMATLEKAAVPMAAALNAIKGETLTLSRRRGWERPLDQVLFTNAIDRETFEAMHQATRNAFPDFRRYLKARANLMGLPVLRWYDRLAPLGEGSISWAYDDATDFVVEQFSTYSEKMADLARRSFADGWIDAEPREGKRGGGFCISIRDDESRILMNFEPSFASVGTLAHELGHAYHNLNLAQRTPLQKQMPMTLAETASTFCQKIVENAALKTAVPQDQLIILDGLLEYATRVVISATSNFIFEDSVFERRKERELSVEEFCQLDVEAQKEGFGDAIDPDYLYPYRWAYVPHYYVSTYYNFPYTFGLLFGLGLYAQYQQEPNSFKEGYDELLSMTGMADAAELAGRFGINVRDVAFWESSLDILRNDIKSFERLVGEQTSSN